MDLSNITKMDSAIVLGIVNEKLRLECNSFEELISQYEIDADKIEKQMDSLGYQYDPLTNQFKSHSR
ncbi:DUF4250 domain-containing protein [Vibrio sp. Of7-15]|uniref:DUF4250 domain-containing protein n=1 Tax=Vibrio sp. Of7-15 TaxID=2724879 RepID=UPI001EF19FBA|nr:DUF4250 domain-containing protein [Vibrio sp. Of7-15]MCG7497016.1 DUF4250 domain-containing protein [Vibrio sp. Of7-15]